MEFSGPKKYLVPSITNPYIRELAGAIYTKNIQGKMENVAKCSL
jgi:hypothetical protein